ncbi:hypothetical protein W97_04573 [Coniosporium apollinis CBS 100218]|uniref:Putative transcription factor kapC n=1 Tax=Coniosporium apollinis (strain CBS 100218) TaxID=1168221 RepID=R7YTW2_CONA1|nr:uncharacterized protein W97_04573 [Coniosporium apollinis CBS 100218]EON65335.1 hypothetical protein W97_04573 [Coniosporium apollinis CBS 100218]
MEIEMSTYTPGSAYQPRVQRVNYSIIGLREHLLAAGAGQQPGQPVPTTIPPQAHIPLDPQGPLDPAIQMHYATQHPHSPLDHTSLSPPADFSPDGHGSQKGRRELSSSKRAAQNRAAQRAFRQRKEEYIQKLKDQVKDYDAIAADYKTLREENYALRDYVISLQGRLLELQGEVPPAPGGIDLSRPPPLPTHGLPLVHPGLDAPAEQLRQEAERRGPEGGAAGTAMSNHAAAQLQQAAALAAARSAQQLSNAHKHPHEDGPYTQAGYSEAKKQKTGDEDQPSGGIPSYSAIFPAPPETR